MTTFKVTVRGVLALDIAERMADTIRDGLPSSMVVEVDEDTRWHAPDGHNAGAGSMDPVFPVGVCGYEDPFAPEPCVLKPGHYPGTPHDYRAKGLDSPAGAGHDVQADRG